MRRDRILNLAIIVVAALLMSSNTTAAAEKPDTSRGDQMLAAYFRAETQKIADASAAKLMDWKGFIAHREEYRRQLREMLGLDPLPERTPLQTVVTGTLERDDFKVEKLYFQSRPHLYVTANLYLPKKITGRLPAILYVCGHSPSTKDGVSFGNKTKFQHHGAWFAQNGYVCLVIDSLQLGEIGGIHHGTYRENMWWWNARGYTPAGVETWNSMRAIDYLVSRPEVDPNRIGMTGRSGGGAYTWYTTALDDRIKCAVPVAGITNLKNHVVDGCVEHHCDCMYFVNTYRWDFPQVAALAAPRPLLILNTEQDPLFPVDGVNDIYQKVRHLYEQAGKGDKILMQTAPGPHEDLPVLQRYALQWFNQQLKGVNPRIESAAKDYFKREELKVFDKLPADQINTHIHETFVPRAPEPPVPATKEEWNSQRERWMSDLRKKCFAGWPNDPDSVNPPQLHGVFDVEADGVRFAAYDFDSQPGITLRLYLALPKNVPTKDLVSIGFWSPDEANWRDYFLASFQARFSKQLARESLPKVNEDYYSVVKWTLSRHIGLAFIAPRGFGLTNWSQDRTKQTHIRRRFMLLGQTLDGMRVWDVRRAIQALRTVDMLRNVPLWLCASNGEAAGIALYAALFEPNIDTIGFNDLPRSHRVGPHFLNVQRFLDMPQTVSMVAERTEMSMPLQGNDSWHYPFAVIEKFGWDEQVQKRSRASAERLFPKELIKTIPKER